MELKISWNEDSKKVDVPETESDVWKEIASILLDIPIPNMVEVICDNGYATLMVGSRGSYVKNGEKKPSMFVNVTNNIRDLKPSTYKECYLTCINPESNNYKFYQMTPTAAGIDVKYGRIGSQRGELYGVRNIQVPYEPYLYWVRYFEKLSKGYTDQSSIYLAPVIPKTVEKKKDATSPAAVLYNKLKKMARQYVSETCVSAIVTEKQVKDSKKKLKELSSRKTVNGFNKKLMEIMTISPRRVSRVSDLLAKDKKDFAGIICREEDLVSAMEVLVIKDVDEFAGHGIEVYEATDKQKEEVVSKLSPTLAPKVKTVYRVICKEQKERFDNYLKKNGITKVKQLWHGSKNENWLSIILNGLKLNPNAAITGKMFGQGIYFAPSSMKSWGYTSYRGSYWARGNSNTAYMGLYATAYGIPLDVYSSYAYSQSMLDSRGKNCVHAHAGQQLLNDEIVYYNEDCTVLNYIVEFE